MFLVRIPRHIDNQVLIAGIESRRRVIHFFSATTAVAHGSLPPRILDLLDDGALRELVTLCKKCEHIDKWPEKLHIATKSVFA